MAFLKKLVSILLVGILSVSLMACEDTEELLALMEEFGDLSEEEIAALMEAYENGDLDLSEYEDIDPDELSKYIEDWTFENESGPVPKIDIRSLVDYEYSDDFDSLIFKGGCHAPVLSPDSADMFPELSEALEENCEESFEAYNEEKDEYVEAASEHYEDEPDFFEYGSYENNTAILLRRLDDKVFSFAEGWNAYEGGAHGIYTEYGRTFDVKTGEELELTDIFPDTDGLEDVICEKLLEKYDEEIFFDLEESITHYDAEATEYQSNDDDEEYDENYICPYNWTLTPYGIQFYFGPYELAAYAYGSQEILIGYDEYPKAFNPDYVPDDEDRNFVYDFIGMTDLFDIDGDGEGDQLRVDYEYDDDFKYLQTISAYVNGDHDSFDEEDLWIEPAYYISHYIKLADGRQYVYAEAIVYDDHNEIFVFDLNSGVPEVVDRVYLESLYLLTPGEDYFEYEMLTDPEDMVFERGFDLLSTFYGVRSFYVGDDGMPESDERYLRDHLDYENKLVSTVDLTCDIVDEDGDVIVYDEVIDAGEEFVIYATDGESYVDAYISDDTIVRIYFTSSEYPCYIDGVSAEDCFEVLYYAG
ncbi:MAG: RsiV family protein [Lachnospiraceae bacterium]|nr:RsiV family protein [Lachnospiraceae bacterium]